jgi:hypothetical protein
MTLWTKKGFSVYFIITPSISLFHHLNNILLLYAFLLDIDRQSGNASQCVPMIVYLLMLMFFFHFLNFQLHLYKAQGGS